MRVATNITMAKTRRQADDPSFAESAAPQSAGDTTAATPDRERIAMRAYEIYLARGCGEGQELDDWLCAEKELNGEAAQPDAAAD
jgi:hypothetical protein